MRHLLISKNIEYLDEKGIKISERISGAIKKDKLPELDDLIEFSNNSGISINDFLFVDIEQKESIS